MDEWIKCPMTDQLLNKMWSVHTMEYSVLKRNEILTYSTTWMNPKDVMLSELSQTHKNKQYIHATSFQSCLILCDSMDCSPTGSSVHGMLQARMLEWAAISSFRGSSGPNYWIHISYFSCTSRQVLYHSSHLGFLKKCSVLHPKVHALTTWPPPSPGTLDPGPPGTCLPPRARAPEAATPEALSLGSRALRKESTRSQHRLWLLCASNCPGVGWQDIGIGLSSTNQFEA